jgi:glucosamine--fructose-6-phosphate aminotransferase (isomerizing)
MTTPITESALYRTIHRQPANWRRLLARDASPITAAAARLQQAAHILLVGTGTSYHAAQLGAYLLRAAGRFAWAEHSHDFASYPFPLGPHDAVIVISHTGWKQYSRRCIARAHGAGAWCLAITGENTALPGEGSGGSPHQVLHTVEQERSAAYTASYTGALIVLAQLAVHLGAPDIAAALPQLPAQAEDILARQDEIRAWVRAADLDTRFMYTGNGLNGWTAAEGALKAKEAAYVTAEGMATEHLLHGPFFGLNPGDHLLLLNTPGPFSARAEELAGLAHEIGLDIVWFGTPPARPNALTGFSFGETVEVVSPLLAVLPLQLLACYLAEAKGANPDSARMDVEPFARPLTQFLEQKKF